MDTDWSDGTLSSLQQSPIWWSGHASDHLDPCLKNFECVPCIQWHIGHSFRLHTDAVQLHFNSLTFYSMSKILPGHFGAFPIPNPSPLHLVGSRERGSVCVCVHTKEGWRYLKWFRAYHRHVTLISPRPKKAQLHGGPMALQAYIFRAEFIFFQEQHSRLHPMLS